MFIGYFFYIQGPIIDWDLIIDFLEKNRNQNKFDMLRYNKNILSNYIL